jgi:hypothetical protein
MQQMLIFRVHWMHKGKVYFDELSSASATEAKQYFNDHKRSDVSLARVELIGPDDGAVRVPARSPDSPFDPLMARRRLDKDEDAR